MKYVTSFLSSFVVCSFSVCANADTVQNLRPIVSCAEQGVDHGLLATVNIDVDSGEVLDTVLEQVTIVGTEPFAKLDACTSKTPKRGWDGSFVETIRCSSEYASELTFSLIEGGLIGIPSAVLVGKTQEGEFQVQTSCQYLY